MSARRARRGGAVTTVLATGLGLAAAGVQLFGDDAIAARHRDDPHVQVNGPGRSAVVLGSCFRDQQWTGFLSLTAAQVAALRINADLDAYKQVFSSSILEQLVQTLMRGKITGQRALLGQALEA